MPHPRVHAADLRTPGRGGRVPPRDGRRIPRIPRRDIEQARHPDVPWASHADDDQSYWVTSEMAATILNVDTAQVELALAGERVPHLVHQDGTKMYRRHRSPRSPSTGPGAGAVPTHAASVDSTRVTRAPRHVQSAQPPRQLLDPRGDDCVGGQIGHSSRHGLARVPRGLRAKRGQLQERHPVRHVVARPGAFPLILRQLHRSRPMRPIRSYRKPQRSATLPSHNDYRI